MNCQIDKLRVAILGSGNIGTDLLVKIMRSPYLVCTLFSGRNLGSPGIAKAMSLGVPVSDQSVAALERDCHKFDLVFDATSAVDHQRHAPIFKQLGKRIIDMTPSQIGEMCIPAVNLQGCVSCDNVNMVTCGGQASVPLAYCLAQVHPDADYIEVISSISARSAGPATRRNLDEYIETTEKAISQFSGCKRSKAILNLNPAIPCINMQTTLLAKVKEPDLARIRTAVEDTVSKIQKYVPGYQLIVPPTIEGERLVIMVKVQGQGDYLPSYAGNLDIINCAAIAIAEEYSKRIQQKRVRRHDPGGD